MKNEIDARKILLDEFFEQKPTQKAKEYSAKIVELENVLFSSLSAEQRKIYDEITYLQEGQEIVYQQSLIDFCFDFLCSVFSK